MQVNVSWEIQTSDQAFDDTGVGLATDVLKTGAGTPIIDEAAERVRVS